MLFIDWTSRGCFNKPDLIRSKAVRLGVWVPPALEPAVIREEEQTVTSKPQLEQKLQLDDSYTASIVPSPPSHHSFGPLGPSPFPPAVNICFHILPPNTDLN